MMRLALLVALALAAWLLWPLVARAHGDHAWVPRRCCGPGDCFPVEIVPERRGDTFGYRLPDGDWVPHTATQPSLDPLGRHWRCYSLFPVKLPRPGCVFVAPGGS